MAILIDGGFVLRRLRHIRRDLDHSDAAAVGDAVEACVARHLTQISALWPGVTPESLLYRAFYYDARPFLENLPCPTDPQRQIRFENTPEARFRLALFQKLRRAPAFAVRLGDVRQVRRRKWSLKTEVLDGLLKKRRRVEDLIDADFDPGFQQKGVDMRLGVDIVSLALKRQVTKIVLVTGDADFVPATKLARREGVQVILDPLWQNVADDLWEHIDGVQSGFERASDGLVHDSDGAARDGSEPVSET